MCRVLSMIHFHFNNMRSNKYIASRIPAAVFLTALILVSPMRASSTEPAGASEQRQAMLTKLDTALAAKDRELINTARREIESLPPRVYIDKAKGKEYVTKFQLMLAALHKVAAAQDPSFDPNDRGRVNITPPMRKSSTPQTIYSGMSPDEIKDPEVREEYKRMIATNAVKVERYNAKRPLYDARDDWIRVIEEFRTGFFGDSAEDVNTIAQLVYLEIKDPALKKEVTELLAVKKK